MAKKYMWVNLDEENFIQHMHLLSILVSTLLTQHQRYQGKINLRNHKQTPNQL